MPKNLFLCRHADALLAITGQTDSNRNISAKGISEAQTAAQWMANFGLPVDAVVSSAAVRTTETARILASGLGLPLHQIYSVKELYNCATATLLRFLAQLAPHWNTVVVVAHNPAVSEVSSKLNNDNNLYVPTAGVNYFTFLTHDWFEIEVSDFKLKVNF
ncbi:SixA phosphatase family protein [Adhaeribacter aquaticus]|uniref:SixA phosphatase family protein n=1 Tax=Adhaeribacter aquaticus TaxID=299567 RepID=UPI00040581BC|nr:histidine phosphatase family protein [Adhaeribacter aquaticus]